MTKQSAFLLLSALACVANASPNGLAMYMNSDFFVPDTVFCTDANPGCIRRNLADKLPSSLTCDAGVGCSCPGNPDTCHPSSSWQGAAAISTLVDAALNENRQIKRVFLGADAFINDGLKYACSECDADVVALLTELHSHGIEVYATYAASQEAFTERESVKKVVNFNACCGQNAASRIDGAAINNEAWSTIKQAITAGGCAAIQPEIPAGDLKIRVTDYLDALKEAKTNVGDLKLHYSLGWHWGWCDVPASDGSDPGIPIKVNWNGSTKRIDEHMLDAVDSVDVQVATNKAITMKFRLDTSVLPKAEAAGKDIFALAYLEPEWECYTSFGPLVRTKDSAGTASCPASVYTEAEGRDEANLWTEFDALNVLNSHVQGGLQLYGSVFNTGIPGWPKHSTRGTAIFAATYQAPVAPPALPDLSTFTQVVMSDCVEETGAGYLSKGSASLELGSDFNRAAAHRDITAGLKFDGISASTPIEEAYIQFESADSSNYYHQTDITLQIAVDTSPTAGVTTAVTSRTTSAQLTWKVPAWPTAGGYKSVAQRTPDLAAVLNELVTAAGSPSSLSAVIIIRRDPATSDWSQRRTGGKGGVNAPVLYYKSAPVPPPPATDVTMSEAMEETAGNYIVNSPSTLHFGNDFNRAAAHRDMTVGMRFAGIPVGTVDTATIQFTSSPSSNYYHSTPCTLHVTVDSNPAATVGAALSSRSTTGSPVSWSVPTWPKDGSESTAAQKSPDLAAVLGPLMTGVTTSTVDAVVIVKRDPATSDWSHRLAAVSGAGAPVLSVTYSSGATVAVQAVQASVTETKASVTAAAETEGNVKATGSKAPEPVAVGLPESVTPKAAEALVPPVAATASVAAVESETNASASKAMQP